MSSTEVSQPLSPKKKTKQQKMEQQIVSSDVTNDNSNESDSNSSEPVSQPELINNNDIETNKDCQVDACMEPIVIQDCVVDDKFVTTNSINETNCESPVSVCDIIAKNSINDEEADSGGTGGGGFMKTNLSLNLNNEKILSEEDEKKSTIPKNKKFLESTEDQIMNQIFFSTISVTPTTEDDVLLHGSKFLASDNTPLTPSEIDPDLIVESVDFFNRKIDEDDAFDTTYTDTVDNYQENDNDGNLCSLNDNFNENYCSFSSIDYNITNIQHAQQQNAEDEEEKTPPIGENELMLGAYAEQMRQQRPSIVIDCYDSDSKTEEEDVVIGDEKINDYCFYFDQTIEEDDDDACYISDNLNETNLSGDDQKDTAATENNGKTQGEGENDIDECFETETESENDDVPNEEENDEASDDEGVINESCISVNSAVESLESESTVVKKTVKKSVKSTKTTSKKSKTISSTTESSSSITTSSSKAESFETSISNGSVEMIEQQNNVIEHHESKSITNGKENGGAIEEKHNEEQQHQQKQQVEGNGIEKKKSIKKKSKKKKESEKENISVNTSTSIQQSMSMVSPVVIQAPLPITNHCNNIINTNNHHNDNGNMLAHDKLTDSDCQNGSCNNKSNQHQKFIMSSSFQLHEDDLSKIDVKSLKQKYSDAVEKQSMKSLSTVLQSNGSSNATAGYLSIRKDVSVKHLCRSFGDLSSINNSEEYNTNYFQHVYRDSYCSLIGLTETNNNNASNLQQQQPHSLNAFKRSVSSIKSSCRGKLNLGIKQFDMKSSFSKFDALQKKNLESLQNGKSGENGVVSPDVEKKCHACDKVVFQMEQIKAEKKFWHRSCFRCAECNKQLNVDTYQSHEGVLYCKPHFKSLFAPKVVEENNEPVKPRKLEMIILENQPVELPPDVIRSSDKADLGLDELHQINLRQRFQLFENAGQQETKVELDKANNVKRSTSILSKLARFQAKGMDVGDDSLNGISYEHSSEEEEEDDDDDLDDNDEDVELKRAKRAQKEKPMSFKEMHDIKSKFESGQIMTKEERREERKQELQNIRSRLFMGKQAKIKEMYQQAVAESEQTITSSGKKSDIDIDIGDKAKSIKERFEKGDIFDENGKLRTLKDEEMAVFEQGLGKQSRSLFLELDASVSKSTFLQESPSSANLNSRHTPRQHSQTVVSNDDIVRSDSKIEDVQIETADIVSKFKFFETYKEPEKEKKSFRITPPRDYQGVTKLPSPEVEANKDPHIARNEKRTDQDEILELQKTASKMLSKFRQMEEQKEERPVGPKPLKRFTPPPESEKARYFANNDDSGPEYSDEEDEEECSEEESEEEEEEQQQDPNYIKSSHKNVDEFLKAAQSAERAKKLREKFEKWEENEIKKEMNNSSVNLYEESQDEGQMETAKSLKARFEQMQKEEPKLPSNRPVKVNRFV
ncbi:hypothetical protein PVAND_011293 [Polypedilum vanderplanki]|uniref:LIM zinc-binding domain-containing protein n=1 Tax=Polypedilum vanderplanki TaxID=319348 RepID=A0A9J6CJY0_POLVA|nr:hypothetical protein PVAND_011293 [Polypedilum vanderplanki]